MGNKNRDNPTFLRGPKVPPDRQRMGRIANRVSITAYFSGTQSVFSRFIASREGFHHSVLMGSSQTGTS